MITELNNYPIFDTDYRGHIDYNNIVGYEYPSKKEIIEKINEIIEYLNNTEEGKEK